MTEPVMTASRDEKPSIEYHPESCCACRWVMWGEDCGHGESDGIDSPHDHCAEHGGEAVG